MTALPSPAHTPDDPFLALVRAGAYRDALGLAAREHGPALGRLCMAMLGAQGEAEEAAQETLLAAHDALPSFRGEGSVRAFLFAIARRVCARRIEVRGRRERRLQLVHDAREASGPDELLALRRRAAKVREVLEALRPSDREALLLRYEAGLDYGEVAATLGLDEAAARKRVSRALARMRELFGTEVG